VRKDKQHHAFLECSRSAPIPLVRLRPIDSAHLAACDGDADQTTALDLKVVTVHIDSDHV
jgi:hypothetical protein